MDIIQNHVIIDLVCILSSVLSVAGLCGMFKKAGIEWWKALIPFYNNYTLFKLTWSIFQFWIYLLFGVLFGIGLMGMPIGVLTSNMSMVSSSALLTFISMILIIAWTINLAIKVTEAYSMDKLFAILIVILAPVAYMILGFTDSSVYKGVKNV